MEMVFEEWNAYARKKVLKERETNLKSVELNSKLKIVGITGMRRTGKSSLLILLYQKLINENKRAAYINLEDGRIKDSKTVLDDIIKWFGDDGYLLLDEITSVQGWQTWLARNHELLKGKLNFIVSSSRSLASPTKPLRGRLLLYEIYPLSFKEFLKFKSVEVEHTTAGIGKIEKSLAEYLTYGGFPEVALLEDKADKIRILNSYFKDIISLDVAEILEESITTVELFSKYAINTSHFSASKCLNFLKTLGYKIGKQSILNLERYSQNAYIFFFVPIFSYKIKDRLQYPRKAYIGDTGLMYAITGKLDMGRLFENAVFLELKRKLLPQQQAYYWKTDNTETDFVVCEGFKVKKIIQVAYDIDNKNTKEREIKGIIGCAKEFGLKDGLIITKEIEGTEIIDGIKIEFIPLWKWLLM